MLLPNNILRTLFRVDGVITTASGLVMFLAPTAIIDSLQLGTITPFWMRMVGLIWLAFGVWLLTLWNAKYTKLTALIAADILAVNGVFLVLAAIFGSFGLGMLGWVTIFGTSAFILFVALQWGLLSRSPRLA